MKILGVLIMVLAVLIAVVPLFFNCLHDGKSLTLANGMKAPMKCFWTAMAAIATAVTHTSQLATYGTRALEMAGGMLKQRQGHPSEESRPLFL